MEEKRVYMTMIPTTFTSCRYSKLQETEEVSIDQSEAENELLQLLKRKGVPSICESISKEIHYAWAVLSGFKTLANVGHFYLACGRQTFGYNPAHDFFQSNGMQLATFALHKFIHNDEVILPVLECIQVYSKLQVDRALEFCAVGDAKEVLMNCIRYHDNKPNVISNAALALGSLIMNDHVKDSLSSPQLMIELLGLLSRYSMDANISRGVLFVLSFLISDADMTAVFIDNNGICLVISALRRFQKDKQIVWYSLGTLNSLHNKTSDLNLIYVVFDHSGIPCIAAALASHMDTEEIVIDGLQLLSKLASLPNTYRAINRSKILDIAHIALFAYSGVQHRHTRVEIKRCMYSFEKCAIVDSKEFARRDKPSRKETILYFLFTFCLMLYCGFSNYDTITNQFTETIKKKSELQSINVNNIDDVWDYLTGPLHESLFPSKWYNDEIFRLDEPESQLGMFDRSSYLLGNLQLRQLRIQPQECALSLQADVNNTELKTQCFGAYSIETERQKSINSTFFYDKWSHGNSQGKTLHQGKLGVYPTSGYIQFISSGKEEVATEQEPCGSLCQLHRLREGDWLDASSRALFAEFNLYNPPYDVHCYVNLLFEFSTSGNVFVTSTLVPIRFEQYPHFFLLSVRFYLEVGLLIGVFWFGKLQVDKLLRYRWFYFFAMSHLIDFSTFCLWIAVAFSRVQFVFASNRSVFAQLTERKYLDIHQIAMMMLKERQLTAWCVALMTVRLLRLVQCFKPLKSTLTRFYQCFSSLLSFFGFACLFFCGFGHVGFNYFHLISSDYQDYSTSIRSAARLFLAHYTRVRRGISTDDILGDSSIIFQFVLRLAAIVFLLNIVITIVREGFLFELTPVESLVNLQKRTIGSQPAANANLVKWKKNMENKIHHLQDIAKELIQFDDNSLDLSSLKRLWELNEETEDISLVEKNPENAELESFDHVLMRQNMEGLKELVTKVEMLEKDLVMRRESLIEHATQVLRVLEKASTY